MRHVKTQPFSISRQWYPEGVSDWLCRWPIRSAELRLSSTFALTCHVIGKCALREKGAALWIQQLVTGELEW